MQQPPSGLHRRRIAADDLNEFRGRKVCKEMVEAAPVDAVAVVGIANNGMREILSAMIPDGIVTDPGSGYDETVGMSRSQ